MGFYKKLSTDAGERRRLAAMQRRAEKLSGSGTPGLIRLTTVSEIEAYELAKDVNRLAAYNAAVQAWQERVTAELKVSVSTRSKTIGSNLEPRLYTDKKYGYVNRIGFSFPRHGVYLHHGASRGHRGTMGSKWEVLKNSVGVQVGTGIIHHTNMTGSGYMGEGGREAFRWFDPIISANLQSLSDIVTTYWDTMIIDATRIFIEK